jgi:hypothetical protein
MCWLIQLMAPRTTTRAAAACTTSPRIIVPSMYLGVQSSTLPYSHHRRFGASALDGNSAALPTDRGLRVDPVGQCLARRLVYEMQPAASRACHGAVSVSAVAWLRFGYPNLDVGSCLRTEDRHVGHRVTLRVRRAAALICLKRCRFSLASS